jgi:hypothetical protein
VTPGQAAFVAREQLRRTIDAEIARAVKHGIVAGAHVGRKMPFEVITDAADAYAQASAARQPQGAPGGFRLITDVDGIRHMVDAGGVRQLTEIDRERGYWELAVSSGNQAAIVQFAAGILAAWAEPQPAPGERFSSLRPEQITAIRAELDDPQPHAPFPMEDPQPAPERLAASDRIVRDILESLCRRDGLPLESTVVPGEPARNYALAERLGIGHVFGLPDEPVMTPAVARPLFGSTLVLAIHPDQDDEAARKGEEAIRAATAGDGVTVVTVRGIEALRTWEPLPGPGPHYYTAGTGCADCRAEAKLAGLSELLEEIGVLAANAPEDGDLLGVLEEIAMRVAAAGVTGAAS